MHEFPAYDPHRVEEKWQQRWAESDAHRAPEMPDPQRKQYVLEMFPYPSGNLHVGHMRSHMIGDVIARQRRMAGLQVLHPMGWDAFGMPAENAAIREGMRPDIRTRANVEAARAQMRALGFSYDWSREVDTSSPDYYRWNQWLFLQLLACDLVYRRERNVQWCPRCETVLAHEQVVGEGECWRCRSDVEVTRRPEWAFRITRYADALLDGLDDLDWPEPIKNAQRDWIGRSEGLEIDFPVVGSSEKITVFTTRADTVFGVTALLLAPEHPLVESIVVPSASTEVEAFLKRASQARSERFRGEAEPQGVDTGAHAINPLSGEKVPVWIANYVVADYGTGAVMSVPAHDSRDFQLARLYDLPVRVVIAPEDGEPPDAKTMSRAFAEPGVMVGSSDFSGATSADGAEHVARAASEGGFGRRAAYYHLRDWGFSRQRYWGTPIPVVHCKGCGAIPVPVDQLPVELPTNAPVAGDGDAPLARSGSFVEAVCPACGEPAQRETETMDTFVDSAWYFLRFCDPHNRDVPFDRAKVDAWGPVDFYVGSAEHAVAHLLYFRFFTRVCNELGLLGFEEPVRRLVIQGATLHDGAPMSAKRGNLVTTDEMIESYGADATRLFALSAAPPHHDLDWSEDGVEGTYRFLARKVWAFVHENVRAIREAGPPSPDELAGAALDLWCSTHQAVERVTTYLVEREQLNTAVAVLRELAKTYRTADASLFDTEAGASVLRFGIETLLRLLYPLAPHVAAELWEVIGQTQSIEDAGWPQPDPAGLKTQKMTIAVQVNGKLRTTLDVPADSDEASICATALEQPSVRKHTHGKRVGRVVYVPGKILNVVTE